MAESTPKESGTTTHASVVRSVIVTVAAIVATYPATVFLLQYYADPHNTGSLIAGGFFAVLAVVAWVAAGWNWSQVLKTRK